MDNMWLSNGELVSKGKDGYYLYHEWFGVKLCNLHEKCTDPNMPKELRDEINDVITLMSG